MFSPDHSSAHPLVGETVVIMAATPSDAQAARDTLEGVAWKGRVVDDADELGTALEEECGALLLAEEACSRAVLWTLERAREAQPEWSELPILLWQTPGEEHPEPAQNPEGLPSGHWSPLERPHSPRMLVAAVELALRAREEQYRVRDLLRAREEESARRDEFLAMLGHELRNPLAAIRYAVELLDVLDEAKETRAPREVIVRQTRHLGQLVDDLLDVARVTRGKIALDLQPLDLNDIAHKSLSCLQDAHASDAHHIEVTPSEDELIVSGDPVRLEQVLSNLLLNAIKYTPSGGKIRVCLERESDFARVVVEDNGIGMDAELLPHVFDLFSQSAQTIDRSRGGLGIGLTLVRGLVELHGGRVHAHSQGLGRGSTFEVHLPLHVPAPEKVPASPEVEKTTARTVLVIEDNDDARQVLCLLLSREGHRVESAGDGKSGLEKLLELRPDIAFVDVGLPELSGYEVAERARKVLGDSVRLVAITGYGQPEDEERAREAGFDEHLTKPVAPDDLRAAIAAAR